MALILAIDPGTTQSAIVVFKTLTGVPELADCGIWPNDDALAIVRSTTWASAVVIEQVASYGMPVGAEVFETIYWSGRFTEAARPLPVHRITRKAIVTQLCGSARAKDSNVRQALLDRFGGSAAVGRKAAPGPLYGIHGDLWAALAVAVVWAETHP